MLLTKHQAATYLLIWISLLTGAVKLLAQSSPGLYFTSGTDSDKQWMVRVVTGKSTTVQAQALKVYLQDQWDKYQLEAQAIGGQREQQEAHILVFRPVFPFSEGVSYIAIYPGFAPSSFTIPIKDYTAAKVQAIFPTSDSLPENILKMYLHFSAPMSVGKSYTHIYLIKEKGDTITAPFLALDPELWNEDRTRLTLWFDPGRVKRDLVPNRLHGAPLEKNQAYTLHIDRKWTDANGHPLARSFTKSFLVTNADRAQPDAKQWILHLPSNNTSEELTIQFGESLDEALSRHAFSILDEKGKELKGQFRLGSFEQSLHFSPSSPWQKGKYQVRINAKLEDLAGNNLNRPFDRDISMDPGDVADKTFYWLPFSVE